MSSSLSPSVPVLASPPWRHWLQPLRASYELHVDGGAWPPGHAAARGEGDAAEPLSLGRAGVRAASLRVHRPLRVVCTAGTVWLTCERDLRDHVLEAGDEHIAQPGDALVLLGMPSASVSISTC